MIELLAQSGSELPTSLPVELTALAALVGIVWWLVKRADADDERSHSELDKARRELVEVRKLHNIELDDMRTAHAVELDEERALSSRRGIELATAVERNGALVAALSYTRRSAKDCTCGALHSSGVIGLIDHLLTDHP